VGTVERHALLAPQRPEQLDLLVDARPAVGELLAEGLVLDGVPPEADAQAEVPAGEEVDFGRLLGD